MATVTLYPANGQDCVWVTTLIAPQEFHYGIFGSVYYSDGVVTGRECGVRFAALPIPKGSVINSARIDFISSAVKTDAVTIRIKAEAADDSLTFRVSGTDATNFSAFNSRPRTTAYYDWAAPSFGADGTPVSLPESNVLVSLLQEVISRSGWKQGNALSLFFYGLTGGVAFSGRSFHGYETSNYEIYAPHLYIDYTPPGINYGIKVSRDGYSALTLADSPTNIKKFAMISNLNMLKVKTTAKVTLGAETTTIPHGLGYKPICWVFQNDGGSVTPVYYNTSGTYFYVDNTNLVIRNVTGTRDFVYYIFYDPV
jgi:hypothetical protein